MLRSAASSAQTTKSWRAEGVEVSHISGTGMNLRNEVHFKIAVQDPSKMRRENSGDDRTQSVCDGTDRFYSGDGHSFSHSSVASSDCNFSLAGFYKLDANPASATVIGSDRIQIDGVLQECQIIRAEWNRKPQGSLESRSVRTMCIDPVRQLILRDSTEDATSDLRSVRTTTFTSFEGDPKFSLDAFQFSIPTGTIQDQGPQVGPDESIAINGVYPIGPHVSYPQLVSKIEPSYTEEALQARLSGLVLVSLSVAQDGTPQDMKVVRGLGHGLDNRAIESVRQWRFIPGTRDGAPVAVGPLTVAVFFRLP